MININLENDGIDHINIYSKGNTEIGRMLSNFYRFKILTNDGDFDSVEAYWYWLGIEDCKEKDVLRHAYGFTAKQIGKDLIKKHNPRHDDEFEKKILKAIWYKFRRNKNLLHAEYLCLPFEHYYNYGGKIIDVKNKYLWMIDGIEKMRDFLISKI